MKEILTGLEAEDEIENSIVRSDKFKEILEGYCNMPVNLAEDGTLQTTCKWMGGVLLKRR